MNKKGFTLVEMMVVLAIFSVATVVIIDIFMMAGKAQRRTLAIEKIQSDARYSMEAMSKEIKMDMIDYGWAGYAAGITLPEDELALLDADNNSIIFKKSADNCPAGTAKCLTVSIDGGVTWASITSKGNNVEDLKFYIDPAVDPFLMNAGNTYDSDNQPRVTIVLATKGIGGRVEEQQTIYLETTVSSRIYRR
ncbi:MAG: prepilin-type N-terminal cleavage/methylation domain-containing protein [Patescibacteria group bacterium]|jgi:prepilin-type N-terminal cleavage/methylation domain-containing protein